MPLAPTFATVNQESWISAGFGPFSISMSSPTELLAPEDTKRIPESSTLPLAASYKWNAGPAVHELVMTVVLAVPNVQKAIAPPPVTEVIFHTRVVPV